MARWSIDAEVYRDLKRAGLTDQQICDRYRILPETLRTYKYKWQRQEEESKERQFFLIEMRKAAGFDLETMAENLGVKRKYLDVLENEPRGVTIQDKQWEKLETTIRVMVKSEIRRKRDRETLIIPDSF
ncbi:hypothetical protein [Bacillus sp. CGMCC 1.16541]|uniref:hypothetical protein n=1 Tax=Bacillus sp. CGMCC 1.16541 TaxID=2185143 RepID=UPI000D73B833|nr:hypothetical protein [Bacillus sp. CGMCC 1.16541]